MNRASIKLESALAERTLVFLKQHLSGIEFVVTGSYAEDILNNSNKFNKYSDIDVVVREKDIIRSVKLIQDSQNYKSIQKVNDYYPPIPINPFPESDPSPSKEPKTPPFPKPKEPAEPEKPENKTFSEYLLKGNLMPVHIIGSYTGESRKNAVEINGIKYIHPTSPEYFHLAA